MGQTLSVIMPAYNEAAYVGNILERLLDVKLPYGMEMEVVVVDDCSTDATTEKVKEFVKARGKGRVKLLRHRRNCGKGMAIRTGLERVSGEYVVIQDADEEYNPEDFKAMCKKMVEEDLDVLYGSRYLRTGLRPYAYKTFYIGTRLLSRVVNLLYSQHITDEATCYKMFRTQLLRDLRLECQGFEFCPEVTAKVGRRGIKIEEVPISYAPRTVEEGKKIGWRDGLVALWTLLKYRWKKL